MKTYTHLLTLWLFAAPWALHAEELPVVFARSGQKVTLPVGDDHDKTMEAAALWAFGRSWGEPATLKGGAAELKAPQVRVPIVFQVISVDVSDGSDRGLSGPAPRDVLCELVAYPDRPVPWDKDTQLVAVGTPHWFDTWCEAVGLPIRRFKEPSSLDAEKWRTPEKPGLLILGREAAGDGSATIPGLAAEYAINVLVLETDWFSRNEAVLSPKQMTGALADLQPQVWALPPTFSRRSVRVSNRQTWIAGPDYPLVEEVRGVEERATSFRTVFSYLPWQQQLGRTEMADELFLRLLKETVKGAKDRPPLDGRWLLLYPAAKKIIRGERPVLAAALSSVETNVGAAAERQRIRACVLDLRGTTSPPSEFFEGTTLSLSYAVRPPF